MIDLLPMFRCKICQVRLLERDCTGHLQRHGLKIDAAKVMTHFVRGAPEVAPHPGASVKNGFQQGKKRKIIKVEAEPDVPEPDLDDLN